MIRTRTKQILLTLSVSALLLLIVIGINSTYAALKMESGTVRNSFVPMEDTPPSVSENVTPDPDQDGYILEKNDVTVTNPNDFEVNVRAMVIASWQDADGNILAVSPTEGTDYRITYGSGWEKRDDGYYYYSDVLGKDETTLPLLTACQPLKSAPLNGYTLCVDIISQIVQSEIDNGTLPFANP